MADKKHEFEFLPAALEIQESPPSPIGRIISWSLILLLVITVVWAYFGEVNIVAVAQGKIIPSGQAKMIQPLEIGVVNKIHVEDGQMVNAGDPLIELDATISNADKLRMQKELFTAQMEAVRLRALLKINNESHGSQEEDIYKKTRPTDIAVVDLQQALLDSQRKEYKSQVDTINSQINERKQSLKVTKEELKKLKALLPIISNRADAVKGLAKEKLVSENDYLVLKQEQIEKQHDIHILKARLSEIEATIHVTQQQKNAFIAEFNRSTVSQLVDVERNMAAIQKEFEKADQRNNFQTLYAPVSGEVQELVIHTEGGVVTPAQTLMVIVPKDKNLEIDALLANKDIGFVKEGYMAEVKVDAFPFTKYGVIDAEIVNISSDAIPDENLGLVYRMKVLLKDTMIQVDNKLVNLAPGMAVTVEAKTGKRRIIEYFLSPLMEYQDESIQER